MNACHRNLWIIAALAGSAACASFDIAPVPKRMVVVPVQDAKFVPLDPTRPDGAQVAVLWGDPASGPSAMLLKTKKGSVPLHTHTADYHLLVLEGVMKHWGEDEVEPDAKPLVRGATGSSLEITCMAMLA